jgi:hypothetical protein
MKRFVVNCLISGTLGGIVSHAVASLCGRRETGRGELPMHAVSHIAYGDAPESHGGLEPRDAVIGTALHHGACLFWAPFFEALFGRDAERSTAAALAGGATIAAAAYLSNRSLFLVYAGLALGFAAGARLRGLRNHEIEDRDEREESRKAERRPDPVVTPEERR